MLRALIVVSAIFSVNVSYAVEFELGLKHFRAGDPLQAFEVWHLLAQAGNADAQHAIGMMHEYGRGLERDDKEAAIWYQKAAEQGMAEAQYRLGVFNEHGWGVSSDAALAAKWYERAAQGGHAFAQHDLAYMYLNGQGVTKDAVQAYKWLKIASIQRPDLMTKHLANLSKNMNSADINAAELQVDAWLSAQKI